MPTRRMPLEQVACKEQEQFTGAFRMFRYHRPAGASPRKTEDVPDEDNGLLVQVHTHLMDMQSEPRA